MKYIPSKYYEWKCEGCKRIFKQDAVPDDCVCEECGGELEYLFVSPTITKQQVADCMEKLEKNYLEYYNNAPTKKEYKLYMIKQAVLFDVFEALTNIDIPII